MVFLLQHSKHVDLRLKRNTKDFFRRFIKMLEINVNSLFDSSYFDKLNKVRVADFFIAMMLRVIILSKTISTASAICMSRLTRKTTPTMFLFSSSNLLLSNLDDLIRTDRLKHAFVLDELPSVFSFVGKSVYIYWNKTKAREFISLSLFFSFRSIKRTKSKKT